MPPSFHSQITIRYCNYKLEVEPALTNSYLSILTHLHPHPCTLIPSHPPLLCPVLQLPSTPVYVRLHNPHPYTLTNITHTLTPTPSHPPSFHTHMSLHPHIFTCTLPPSTPSYLPSLHILTHTLPPCPRSHPPSLHTLTHIILLLPHTLTSSTSLCSLPETRTSLLWGSKPWESTSQTSMSEWTHWPMYSTTLRSPLSPHAQWSTSGLENYQLVCACAETGYFIISCTSHVRGWVGT